MTIINIAIIIFIVLETSNVLMLYFIPGTNKGNGMGAFTAWERADENPELYALIQYLVNWVAGTKLIFISLLIVIVAVGNDVTKFWSAVVMIPSIATFYWRLYPIIRSMDERGMIKPRGYSKTLAIMIGCFVCAFVVAVIVTMV